MDENYSELLIGCGSRIKKDLYILFCYICLRNTRIRYQHVRRKRGPLEDTLDPPNELRKSIVASQHILRSYL